MLHKSRIKLVALVSIYNSSQWLRNRIINLINTEAYKRKQLLIYCVNASSPDEQDHKIMQEFSKTSNIIYKTIKQCNVYTAWNYIINNTNSEYLTTANTDDIVSEDCYTKLMGLIESGNDVAYPSWHTTSLPNQTWGQLFNITTDKPGVYAGDIGKGLVGHFPLWKRSLHDKIGLFNQNYRALGDAEFWARCYYLAKAKFKWYTKPLGVYLWRGNLELDKQNLWNRTINQDEWDMYHAAVAKYRM